MDVLKNQKICILNSKTLTKFYNNYLGRKND